MEIPSVRYSYGRTFSWSPDQLGRFAAQTERLATFDRAPEENFILYRLSQPAKEAQAPYAISFAERVSGQTTHSGRRTDDPRRVDTQAAPLGGFYARIQHTLAG
jgi:hypothetical protein